jgi:FkbM family methyltransferase
VGSQNAVNAAALLPAEGLRPSDRFFLAYRRSRQRGFFFLRRLWQIAGGSPFIRVRNKYGAIFEINPVGYIENYVVDCGFYEAEVFEGLRGYLGPGAVLWDIGSNFGLHAVTAKTVSPETRVVAFEPVPELLARMRANAALNGAAVESFGLALSCSSGPRFLYMPRGGTSGCATLKGAGGGDLDELKVDCLRADELIREGMAQLPTALKLDVEGAEDEVLDGFGTYLENPRLQAVVFEGAPGLAESERCDPVGARLCRAGFKLRKLQRLEPTQHNLENYLAFR